MKKLKIMKNILFTLALLISVSSFAQNHPAKPATAEIIKSCDYWTQQNFPVVMNPESKLVGVNCGKGSFIFDIMLYTYKSNKSADSKILEALNKSFLSGVKSNPDFKPFRENLWQIGYLFSDKNDKYLFSLIYDSDENGRYFRNVDVEMSINKMLSVVDDTKAGQTEYKEYHENGQLANKSKYDDKGNRVEWSSYNKQGKKEVDFKFYYKNGQLESVEKWKDDIKINETKYTYYDDDEYMRSGVSTNEIGDLHTITDYKNGKMNGKFLKYHEKKLVIKENYNDGKSQDKGFWFHPNGQINREINYKEGQIIYENCWDESGNEIDCI